ncbi:MBL fold metallo-hydrolase [Streptomyces sp. BG9H]|uniref:MBL fold metallo-hydrolase n=2 Tax=Streptomyces anatolicus TaxID=2675858 RepID=A0ABS6YP68_9ACTN|nr:MBL fold metallo-hydrolase [Streptomyces anatolicus]
MNERASGSLAGPTNEPMMLGDVEVLRVVELEAPFLPAAALVPGMPEQRWRENAEWLAPDFWDPESGRVMAAVQTWVLRSEGRTVLVDTGVGNGRVRPHAPHFADLDTDFLARLASAGVRPEDVDIVVNTHLHADHVGWNTRDEGGNWVPTFPRATYLMPAADHAHFGPRGADEESSDPVFADSVAPVDRAGQTQLWSGTHRIDRHLTLEAAPGHTPGSSVLRLASGADRAVFVGDLLHTPVQILEPGHSSCLCVDPREAAATRVRVLGRAADERELVVPAHFRGAGAAEVRREGGKFAVSRWAA